MPQRKDRPWIEGRDIPNTQSGRMFLHCGLCLDEIKAGLAATDNPAEFSSPEHYARLSVSMTALGFQVWCVRHDCNVCHIDFEGQQHPANQTRQGD